MLCAPVQCALASRRCHKADRGCWSVLQGYLVLAVEHNDGSASAVRLPGGEWRLYGGLGDEEAQVSVLCQPVIACVAAWEAQVRLHVQAAPPGSARQWFM